MDPSENPPRFRTHVLVGLDIGTTFSGISFSALPETRKGPTDFWWPADGMRHRKIPTKIVVSGTSIEWFKLGMLHRDDLEQEILNSVKFRKLTRDRERMNITAVDATAEYLQRIWKIFRDELQFMITDPQIQLTITVPVLWPDYARKSIHEAVYRADIINNDDVELAPKFVAESEAAALAIFSAAYYLEDTPFSKIQPGQVVIVCDCGGGTTDMATYEICSIRPFSVSEFRPGQRILAGACILDDGFMALLKVKMAQVISPQVFRDLTEEDFANIAYDHWENGIKKLFRDNFPTKRISLPSNWAESQPSTPSAVNRLQVSFTHDEIASIFNPIVEQIPTLIENEMGEVSTLPSENVSYLVMAGGFSQNRYLRQQIAKTVNRKSPTTNIVNYPNGQGWNAASQGAVIHALQSEAILQPVLVTSRILRAHWGVGNGRGSTLWLVVKDESLDANSPNLRTVPADALSVEDPISRDVFGIHVYCGQLQNDVLRTREVCILSWKTPDVGLNSNMKPVLKDDLEIDFKWDGTEMEFSLFYGGVQQSSMEVKHPWDV